MIPQNRMDARRQVREIYGTDDMNVGQSGRTGPSPLRGLWAKVKPLSRTSQQGLSFLSCTNIYKVLMMKRKELLPDYDCSSFDVERCLASEERNRCSDDEPALHEVDLSDGLAYSILSSAVGEQQGTGGLLASILDLVKCTNCSQVKFPKRIDCGI